VIYTQYEIELEVSQLVGTWVKRKNLRKKLTNKSNNEVNKKIIECKSKIRDLKAMGARQGSLRFWFSEITKLEIKLL
jgi:hypothetical protein